MSLFRLVFPPSVADDRPDGNVRDFARAVRRNSTLARYSRTSERVALLADTAQTQLGLGSTVALFEEAQPNMVLSPN